MGSVTPHRSRTTLERDEQGNPRFRGCSKIIEYEFLGKLGEGTFGYEFFAQTLLGCLLTKGIHSEVYKARSKATGDILALKKILMHNEKDGVS